MINFRNINSVAKYERKTLSRSWFFRIFSIIALLYIFGINMGVFAEANARWVHRAIPANLPYMNVLFINVAQAIIAVFLASDFLQRDKKLDTTEVIYARPISNGEYVIGKTFGIISLFLGLMMVVLTMALVFNLVMKDTPVVWEAYLYYILLISIPTLVFILGLSFFLMMLLKNQAITFVVLLGYIGVTLFYFKDKLYGLLDYMAFNMPMVYSDFTGFSDFNDLLLQRGAYLLLGVGFIFATIRFLNRLPQVGRWNFFNLSGFVVFIIAGFALGYQFYSGKIIKTEERRAVLALNNVYATYERPDVLSNDIKLEQHGHSLEMESELQVGRTMLDTLVFSLNPGFRLDSIVGVRGEMDFVRDRQIVLVTPDYSLDRWRNKLTFYYHGVPDESVAYLDINENRLSKLKKTIVATFGKKPAIVDEDYLLLSSELLWYPTSGVGFNDSDFQSVGSDFVRFSLKAKVRDGLRPVAAGAVKEEEGVYTFSPETDLNYYSLVVGPFEERSITVDETEYNLYLKSDHDYFSEYFSELGDTIGPLIQEAKDEYEYDELDLYYSAKRINLVEVPAHFHAYERPYVLSTEYIQPEMILLPERGVGLSTLGLRRMKNAEDKRNKERKNTRSEKDIQVDLFKNFIVNTFFRENLQMRGGRGGFGGQQLITFDQTNYSTNPYSVFPLYYSYVARISSSEYPVFNTIIEQYLKEDFELSFFSSLSGGITDKEKANMAMKESSVAEIMRKKNMTMVSSTIFQAGSFVINALKNKVGSSEFDDFLYYYIEDHSFRDIEFEQFARDFARDFGVDIESYLTFISDGTSLPAFLVSEHELIETRDDYGSVYLIRLKITNVGEVKGLVDFTFRVPGQGGMGGGGGMETEHRYCEVDAGETRDLQFVFYDQPRMFSINTLISENIPSNFNVFLRAAEERTESNLEEYDIASSKPVVMSQEGEIVVDNEDEGFESISVVNESKVKQYIDSKKEEEEELSYRSIHPYWIPAPWTPSSHSGFYGEMIRSASICRKGDGGSKARWEALIPEAGFYDIYVYIPVSAMMQGPGNSRGSRGSGQGRGQGGRRGPQFADKGTEYHYVVSSNEGSEEVVLKLSNPEDGWNRLGSFHFPADTALVELSNETNGRRVIADAVKWVGK